MDIDTKDIWLSVNTVAELKGISARAVRLSLGQNDYEFKLENNRKYKIKLDSLEKDLQIKYLQKFNSNEIVHYAKWLHLSRRQNLVK